MSTDLPSIPPALNVPEFHRAWEQWLDYRKAKRKPVSSRAASMQFRKLTEAGVANAIEAIERSIANDWQGLFPVKPSSSRIRAPAGKYDATA